MNYLIISRSNEPETESTPHRAERVAWLKTLQESGTVKLSGPSADRTTSLLVIAADDEAAARQIMAGDPYLVHGVRENELIEWEIHYRSP